MSSERYVQDFTALEALFKRFYKPLRERMLSVLLTTKICRKISCRMSFLNCGNGVKAFVLKTLL